MKFEVMSTSVEINHALNKFIIHWASGQPIKIN
jgi:hypothetical protein